MLAVFVAGTVGCGDDEETIVLGPCSEWMNPRDTPDERARALVAAMTLEQKVGQTHGDAIPEDFRIVLGIDALCIPDLTVTNGPTF